uniref:Phosphoprotein n=1 Tax=Vinca chlorotic spot virus TaxID=3076770 RepID=A0AA96KAK8_9RHAB|nr:phosphoprotein [Vinca chlorotic spot virus]
MSNIGASQNLFPGVPQSSQVQADLEAYKPMDTIDEFLALWPSHGVTPPSTLHGKLRSWLESRPPGSRSILDKDSAALCSMIWTASAEHHHLINKSQVNKMSLLVDQLGEMMRGGPTQPAPTSAKRKHPEGNINKDLASLIAENWTDKRKAAWSKKSTSDYFETFSWLLTARLGLITKPFTSEWVESKGLKDILGDIAAYCIVNNEVLSDQEIEGIQQIIISRLSQGTKRKCLD